MSNLEQFRGKLRSPDLAVLRETGWLAETPPAFRDAVLARCTVRVVGRGESVYNVGDEAGGLFGVIEGQVGVHGVQHRDEPTLYHIVGPGFWTGEYATMTGQARLLSLVARSAVQVARLYRIDFLRIAEADPLAWRYLAMSASRNILRALATTYALRREKATERLAATLVNLAAERGDGPAVLRVSQDDLGALARLSRGSANAALARLEGAGLLRRDYGAITVHDVAALAAYEEAD